MKGPGIDTPDQSLLPHVPVLVLYGSLFALGWWLFPNSALLSTFARRWPWLLALGLLVSLPASALTGMLFNPAAIPPGTSVAAIKWMSSAGTSLVMMLSVFGFLGLFSRFVAQPSAWIRKLAEASYFIYLAHLPLIVALQIAMAHWRLPWWCDLPLVNVICLALLLGIHRLFSKRDSVPSAASGSAAALPSTTN